MKAHKGATLALIVSMCIFGTIGLVRKSIDIPSGMLALSRAWIGGLFLLFLLSFRKIRPNFSAMKPCIAPLLLSGVALGFNWILLFEAYNHTTVATATLCYYMAPVIIILASCILFREEMTVKKALCCAAAVIGAILVSGILTPDSGGSNHLTGVLLGLAAAVLYATVVLLNKRLTTIPSLDKTVVQLLTAGIVVLPYSLLAENWQAVTLDLPQGLLLLIAGIVHTGVAYALYFDAIGKVPVQTAALYSYLDPVLAVLLASMLMEEPLSLPTVIGAILILGGAIINDQTQKKDT